MKYHIITLSPEYFEQYFNEGLMGKAVKENIIEYNIINMRKFAINDYGRVDDYPYGGGAGMVIRIEPLVNAIKTINDYENKETIYFSPKGKVLNQNIAETMLTGNHEIIMICGKYEGVDQRFIDLFVTQEISIGDYILSSGDLPALVTIDVLSRLIPGYLGNQSSLMEESFSDNLLEYPQYTRPEEYLGEKVPQILLSGHHKNIDRWRLEKSIEITKERRPDLFFKYEKNKK
jgi:tRNA (guanine37-N1)-methyltransferase